MELVGHLTRASLLACQPPFRFDYSWLFRWYWLHKTNKRAIDELASESEYTQTHIKNKNECIHLLFENSCTSGYAVGLLYIHLNACKCTHHKDYMRFIHKQFWNSKLLYFLRFNRGSTDLIQQRLYWLVCPFLFFFSRNQFLSFADWIIRSSIYIYKPHLLYTTPATSAATSATLLYVVYIYGRWREEQHTCLMRP